MGDFHLARREYDEAIASYEEALRLDPSNAQLRQKLNDAIMACKKENAIMNTASKCGTGKPGVPPSPTPGSPRVPKPVPALSPALNTQIRARVNMGDFHLGRREFDEAISSYEDGLRLDPSNTELRQKLDEAVMACKKENTGLNEGLACGARAPVVTLIPSGEFIRWNKPLKKGQTVLDNSIEGGLRPMGSLTVPPVQGAAPQTVIAFMIGIDPSGNVTPGRKMSGDSGLAHEVMVAARGWKFQPPTLNGEPVSTSIQVLVIF